MGKRYLYSLFTVFLFVLISFALPAYSKVGSSLENDEQIGQVVYIPKGESLDVMLQNPLKLSKKCEGLSVSAILRYDFIYKKVLIAPKGSVLYGHITSYKPVSKFSKQREVKMQFTNLTTGQGFSIPINATIQSKENDNSLKLSSNNGKVELDSGYFFKLLLTQPVTLKAPVEYKYDF